MPMTGKGKNKLISYIELIRAKLDAIEESGEPLDEDTAKNIQTSVINSVKRLSGGAPAAIRSGIKAALDDAGCLDDAGNPVEEASIPELAAGIDAVAAVLGIEDDDVTPGDEADTLAGVVNRLWTFEENRRLMPGHDFELNMQHKADYDPLGDDARHPTDRASEPLFKHIKESKFTDLERVFLNLLDNYARENDKRENVTRQEKDEMDKFMDLLQDTPHFQYVHKVLIKWGLAPEKLRDFVAKVYDAWFTNYYRGTSSGFEHVFVGEEKYNKDTGRSEIIGLHNWLQYYREEKRGNINYLGYAKKGSCDGSMVSVKFAWEDDDPEVEVKTVSTFLVGTSVAFEFCLATLVFFGGKDGDKPWIKIGDNDCQIVVYKKEDRMGCYVRTVYLQ